MFGSYDTCESNPLDTCGSWFDAQKLIYLIDEREERLQAIRREKLRMFFARHWFPNGESDTVYKRGRVPFFNFPTRTKHYFVLSPEARAILNDPDASDTAIWDNEFDRFCEWMKTDEHGRPMEYHISCFQWLEGRWARLNEGEFSFFMKMPRDLMKIRNMSLENSLCDLRKAAKICQQNGSDSIIFVSSELARKLGDS